MKDPNDNASWIASDRTGSGPPIVFVHGLTYDRRMWAPVIERLRDGFTCVRIDLPGHGESSDASTYDLEAVMSAIRDLCERLELENPILVGHSVGGLIATFYASRFSAAGLVTSDQPLQTEAFLFRLRGMRDQLRSPAFPAIWRAIEAQLGIELIPSDAVSSLKLHPIHARRWSWVTGASR